MRMIQLRIDDKQRNSGAMQNQVKKETKFTPGLT